ncbi:MAG: hypothetical protein ACYS14_03800, partial [Planctomycetota bacterium]
MADVEDTQEQNELTEEEDESKSFIGRFLPWIMVAAIAACCAGAGFSLGRLFGGSGATGTGPAGPESDESNLVDELAADNGSKDDYRDVWY